MFFGAITTFNGSFNIETDPEEVIIDFKNSRVTDMSAIQALDKLTGRYKQSGKKLHLRHLSDECIAKLSNAEGVIDVNII